MLQKRLIIALSFGLVILLIIHFGMTILYLTPENPLRTKHWNIIYAYMFPYFSQNWYLFAPNPVNQHQNLEIKVKYKAKNGEILETKWIDTTKPLLKKLYANRFSPNQRIFEYQSTAMHTYVYNQNRRKQAEKYMRLYADYFLKNYFHPDGKILAYQIRVVTNKFPRFDKRHLPDSKGKKYYNYTKWLGYAD